MEYVDLCLVRSGGDTKGVFIAPPWSNLSAGSVVKTQNGKTGTVEICKTVALDSEEFATLCEFASWRKPPAKLKAVVITKYFEWKDTPDTAEKGGPA